MIACEKLESILTPYLVLLWKSCELTLLFQPKLVSFEAQCDEELGF